MLLILIGTFFPDYSSHLESNVVMRFILSSSTAFMSGSTWRILTASCRFLKATLAFSFAANLVISPESSSPAARDT